MIWKCIEVPIALNIWAKYHDWSDWSSGMCYTPTKKQKETGRIYQAGEPKGRKFFARSVLNLLLFLKKQDDSYFEVSGQNLVFIDQGYFTIKVKQPAQIAISQTTIYSSSWYLFITKLLWLTLFKFRSLTSVNRSSTLYYLSDLLQTSRINVCKLTDA